MCKNTDKVIGICHGGLLGSGGIINVHLLLALCGANYFALFNRCCIVLSVKQPLIIVWEAGQMWILRKGEKYLETSCTVSSGHSMVLIQVFQGMHLVTFIRIVEKDNVCY